MFKQIRLCKQNSTVKSLEQKQRKQIIKPSFFKQMHCQLRQQCTYFKYSYSSLTKFMSKRKPMKIDTLQVMNVGSLFYRALEYIADSWRQQKTLAINYKKSIHFTLVETYN